MDRVVTAYLAISEEGRKLEKGWGNTLRMENTLLKKRRSSITVSKVLTALPAIDFGPPPERVHVTYKLKKLQWEGERKNKIEEDNFRLLQRMGDIMKKNRLDNHWKKEPPNFLHRVGIYYRTRTPSPFQEMTPVSSPDLPLTRKSRCAACSHYVPEPPKIPEERIPWELPKERVSRRRSSSITIPLSSDFDISQNQSKYGSPDQTIKKLEQALTYSHPVSAASKYTRGKSSSSMGSQDRSTLEYRQSAKATHFPTLSSKRRSRSSGPEGSSVQKIVLTQGALELTVNFPPYAEIKVLDGRQEKILQKNECECKAIQSQT